VPDEQKVVASFPRNSQETLQVSLATFKGRTYVDIRLYFTDADGQLKPTKKGITVTPELWDQFRQGIQLAEEELVRRNLWAPMDEESPG
jgi:hypothetical protein